MADTVEAELVASTIMAASDPIPNRQPGSASASQRPAEAKSTAAPIFPQLQNNAAAESMASGATTTSRAGAATDDNDDDEPAVARPFLRTSSPDSAAHMLEDDDYGAGDRTSVV